MGKGKTLQAIVDLAGNIDPSLSKAVNSAVKQLDKINWKSVAVGAAAGAIGVGIAGAVVKGIKHLNDLGKEMKSVSKGLQKTTGATGDALKGLNADVMAVYGQLPNDMAQIGTAIGQFNQKLGYTGKPLQDISRQALEVSELLGVDLNNVIDSSSKAFQQWGVGAKDSSKEMDYVFKVAQKTSTGFDTLMNSVQTFGPQLQAMGYNFETATTLIGQLNKAGVNVDEVLGAMKKSVGALAKDGIGAADGFAMYYEKIKKATSATEAATIASKIFGAKAGSSMAAAIRNGTLAVGDMTKMLQESGDTIDKTTAETDGFAEKWGTFKHKMDMALAPAATTIFDSLNKILPSIIPVLNNLAPLLVSLGERAIPLITNMLIPLISNVLSFVDAITKSPAALDAIGASLGTIIVLLAAKKAITAIKNIKTAITSVDGAVKGLGVAFKALRMMLLANPIVLIIGIALAVGAAVYLIIKYWEPISGFFKKIWGDVSAVFESAISKIESIFSSIGSIISGAIKSVMQYVMPIVENIKGVFTGLIDFVTNIFTGNWAGAWAAVQSIFSNYVGALKGIFLAPLRFIIDSINNFIGGINKIQIPAWVPGVGGKGINIPLIPTLAAGGFTEGLSIAGEAAQEAVISFDPAYRQDNLSYWAQAGQRLGVADESELSILSGSGGGAVYNVGGATYNFSPNITIAGNASGDDIMAKIKNMAPEFLDFIEQETERRKIGGFSPNPC